MTVERAVFVAHMVQWACSRVVFVLLTVTLCVGMLP